jgi:hypothetical protein
MDLYCIKTHSQGIVIAGNIYTLLNTRKCKTCGYLNYDVGVRDFNRLNDECVCERIAKENEIWWVGSELFVPIDNINIEEAIEKINQLQEV